MFKKVIIIFLFASIPAWGAFPKILPKQCGQWLSQIAKTPITKSLSPEEMAQPLPDINLLRPTRPDELRLLRHPLKAVLQFVPRVITNYSVGYAHDVDVIGAINRQYERYSAKKGNRRQLGWASILLTGIILNSPLMPAELKFYNGVDEGIPVAAKDAKIMASWNQWGNLIHDDYRYIEIKMAVANHEISKLKARELAFDEKTQIDSYYESLKNHKTETIQEIEKSPLFSNLNDLKRYKLGITAGFYSIEPGVMSKEEEAEIIKIKQNYYMELQVLSFWISQGAPSDLSKYHGNLGVLISQIAEKPFVKSLLQMRSVLTNGDLEFFIGQDLNDQQAFSIRDVLGIIPYKIADGKLSDQLNLTTLEEVREDTLNTVAKRYHLTFGG